MDEQERNERERQIRNGRAAQIVLNFLDEYLVQKRAMVINELETGNGYMYENLLAQKVYLTVLREFENMLKTYVDIGEIAESELTNNGEQY